NMAADTATVGGVTYHVTPAYLQKAQADTWQTSQDIWQALADLRNYVESTQGFWTGPAQATFNSLMQEYDIYARMLYDSLVDISEGLKGNYINYTESEQSNITNLKKIDSSLPAKNHTIPSDANLS
ncbi:MAG: WXG100 family type VII secretion target, partial [Actinoallomurus sp.]